MHNRIIGHLNENIYIGKLFRRRMFMRRSLITRFVAITSAVAIVMTGIPDMGITAKASTVDSAVTYALSKDNVLDASELPIGATTDGTYGMFSLTSDLTVEAITPLTGEGSLQFTQRIKTGGAGNTTKRAIHFTTTEAGTVTVYALSSSTDDRELGVYDATTGTEVATIKAVGNAAAEVPAMTAEIATPGTYYITPKANCNIYYVKVAQASDVEVARPDWSAVVAPELVSAEVNSSDNSEVTVNFKMDISEAGADRVDVELIDENGEVDVEGSYKVQGTEGSVAIKPTKSGSFTVIAKAYRVGESEVKESNTLTVNDFVRPLDSFNITKALTGKNTTLELAWEKVSEADTYNVSVKEKTTGNEVASATGLTDTEYVVTSGLTALTTYEITITAVRGSDEVSTTMEKEVKDQAERWLSGVTGSAGNDGWVKENGDGSVTISNGSGKIAESEDQFTYYYTEIDPTTENFTLSGTFTVTSTSNASGSKDNQSGFGIMAVDTLVTETDSKYMNSVGAMVARYTDSDGNMHYGIPGMRVIKGYTGGTTINNLEGTRERLDTTAFDWNWNMQKALINNPDTPLKERRFYDDEVYKFTLRRSNTGYHASFEAEDGTVYEEIISYGENLLSQDSDRLYVGFAVGRKIVVTVSDIKLTTINPNDDDEALKPPTSYFDATISSDTTTTVSDVDYEPVFKSNVNGTITVTNEAGTVLAQDVQVKANERVKAPVTLTEGTNKLNVVFTPAVKDDQNFAENTDLSSYAPISYPMEVTVKAFGTQENAIYVSPNGTALGDGSKSNPLDIYTATSFAQPGQEIVLLGGEYNLNKGIIINRGDNGIQDNYITLMSDPNERAVLNFANSTSGGIILKGDYWHIYDLEIKNTKSGKPMHVQGNHNIIEKLLIHDNADTGLQISGLADETIDMWPSYNLVQSVEVYNSCDIAMNDADGFAAKITVGVGNVFRYCISHHNIDDGWDLYAKSTSGEIGQVVIEDCVAYENGYLTTVNENPVYGEGNGFKLGGENMPGAHILRNCVSFNNYAKGVTSNSGRDVQVFNVTSFNNRAENLALYTSAAVTGYAVDGFVSFKPGKTDYVNVSGQAAIESETNYLNESNINNAKVTEAWFASLTEVVPTYNEDGSINLGDFLKLTDAADANAGARFVANPNPTVIVVGTEIGAMPTQEPTPTVAPTQEPTPTVAPTQEPTPTVAPTQAPTVTPTVAPTQAPTVAPTVSPVTKPAKPVVTASKQTKSNIKLSWKKVSGATGYQVQIYKNKKWVTIKTTSATSYTATKLSTATTYKFRVRAYKSVKGTKTYGSYSATVTTTTKTSAPVITVKAGTKKATVTWKKVKGATGYEVYRSRKKTSGYKKVATAKKASTVKFTSTKLTKNKTYYFKVRTYRTVNGKKVYSDFSKVKSVKVK